MPCVNARRCGIFSIFISDVFHPSRYESKRGNKEGKKGKIKGGLKRGDESPRSSKLVHRSTSIRYLPIPRLTGCFGGWGGMKAWMKKSRDRKNGRNMAGPRRRPYNFRPSAARRMFSSMFHPPLYTHAPYTRFSPFLDRSLSALTLSHATVRRRRGAEKKRKSRGKFHSADGGVAREFSTRVFPPPLGFYGRHDCPQPRGGRRGDFRPAGKSYRGAVNFFTRSLLVPAPRRGFKESRESSSLLLRRIGGGTISVARP